MCLAIAIILAVVIAIEMAFMFFTGGSLLSFLVIALIGLFVMGWVVTYAFEKFDAPDGVDTMFNVIWWVVFIVMVLVTGYVAFNTAMTINQLIITGQCPNMEWYTLKCR